MDYGYDYIYEYNYDYPVSHGNGGDAAVTILLTVYLVVLALILAFALASYIFHSIGLYTIGKRMGREHPWLAFIPFARDYFHGELAGEIPLKNKSIKNPGIWKLVVPIIYNAVAGVLYCGSDRNCGNHQYKRQRSRGCYDSPDDITRDIYNIYHSGCCIFRYIFCSADTDRHPDL